MAKSDPNVDDVFDIKQIRRLIELMKEHDLSEIDLRQSSQRIRLCRGGLVETPGGVVPQTQIPSAAIPAPQTPAQTETPKPADESQEHIAYITSPMVGTFYSSANQNAEPYVRVGDHVDPETTVCIVEAMKVFNEIPAEISGRILAVLVEAEESVDYGKPLFKVDTSK
ncbi:MAG: acetyl-CoA carboxylase biotin carboxyl carrier protein [Planctomycetes bacterium]|nr:acetyl-CoA carboxylase biotin carboxyl carrier protein [Planctomycetota bacterium]MBL7041359.1 acetyl-CoA carboxylase biotin carboxyl carrier protein [Pirellulaceae bacterium]